MHYLVSGLVLCLLGAIFWSLFDAHRSVAANASASRDRVQRQLQALYWQKLLWSGGMSRETLVPLAEWEPLATLTTISPGVCVTFAPPQGDPRRLCSQVDALGPVAPVWFEKRDGWLFGQHRMESANVVLGAIVLIAAGIYQWSPIKNACLVQCQTPIRFLMSHGGFRSNAAGCLHLGFLHGTYCVGCCWVLMALLFVVGVMNVLWIAGLALLVLLEKLVPWGRGIARMTGAVCVADGAWMLFASLYVR
jgi:hypothetical protein